MNVDEAPEIMVGWLGDILGHEQRRATPMTEGMPWLPTPPSVLTRASARWSLGGDDSGDFRISSGGVLTFRTSLDFDNPEDANGDNVYMVTVKARDSEEHMAERQVTVTVTGMDDTTPTPGDSLIDRYDRQQ